MFNYSEQSSADLAQFSLLDWSEFYAARVTARENLVRSYLDYVETLASKGLPPIFEHRHLAQLIGIELSHLRYLGSGSATLYHEFEIPKRSGGTRSIASPIPMLAHAQRWLDFNIFRNIQISEFAYGYVKGKSNLDNAMVHIGSEGILHLDITNFFHSIKYSTLNELLKSLGYPPSIVRMISKICTRYGHLPQGAPSSPQLANILFCDADEAISNLCAKLGLRYSRYVDDLTISGSTETLKSAKMEISKLCEKFGFEINNSKTYVQTGRKRIVTGISIGTGVAKLPRRSKRNFSFQVFSSIKLLEAGNISSDDPAFIEKSLGMLAYWQHIEPNSRQASKLRERLEKACRMNAVE